MSVFGIFLVHVFYTQTEYGDLQRKSPYLLRMQENTDRENFQYGHFSRSVCYLVALDFDIRSI